MAKLPYYPMYVEDFDDDDKVRAMTLDQVGLYILCLNASWRYRFIADDPEEVAITLRRKASFVKKSWAAVRDCYVEIEPGQLVNPKQERVRSEAEEKSQKAKSSAEVKWRNWRDRKSANAQPQAASAETPDCERSEKPMRPSRENAHARAYECDSDSSVEAKVLSVAISENEPGFWAEIWHQRHPNKKDRVLVIGEVLRIWNADPKNALSQCRLIDGVHARWCASSRWTEQKGRFVPSLAKWLNDRGWTADPPSELDDLTGKSKLAGTMHWLDERESR